MGEEMTEAELAQLLAAQPDGGGGGGVEDGSAQIIDQEGNTVTVTAAQMASVGIDPDNMGAITEEQIANLLAIANAAAAGHQPQLQLAAPMSSTDGMERKHDVGDPGTAGNGGGGEGDLTMVIGEDGSLKLVEPSGAESCLTAAELTAAGVDIGSLDEEAVQTIVQLALSKTAALKAAPEEPLPKRHRSDLDYATAQTGEDGTLRLLDQNGQELQVAVADHLPSSMPTQGRAMQSGMPQPGPSNSRPAPPNRSPVSQNLIGKEVEVRKDGRTQSAVIRYCRQGAGLKCQFDDGHFEWVQEDQVTLKGTRTGVREVLGQGQKSRPATKPAVATNGPIPSSAPAPPRARTGPGGVSGTPSGTSASVPGIRVTPQTEKGTTPGRCGDPNFVCPICEAKVYQKEPAYIVIRLPACESCADSKILVVDHSESPPPNQSTDPNSTQ